MTHRPRTRCSNCGTPAPCAVYTEGRYEHGTMRGYNHGCGCDDCRALASAARGRTPRTMPLLPVDDGIIDDVAVERLIDGSLPWDRATLPERIEAGRRVIGREGGAVYCADVLRLRHDVIRELRHGDRVTA